MNACNAEHQQLVDDLEAREERLTDWERGFVDSLKHRLAAGQGLSDNQTRKLNELWDRVTEKG